MKIETGNKVRLNMRDYPMGEIINEVPKKKPSDKRLFTIKFNIIDENNYTTTLCFIDQFKVIKSQP